MAEHDDRDVVVSPASSIGTTTAPMLWGPPVGRMAGYFNLLNAPAPTTAAAPAAAGSTLPLMGVG